MLTNSYQLENGWTKGIITSCKNAVHLEWKLKQTTIYSNVPNARASETRSKLHWDASKMVCAKSYTKCLNAMCLTLLFQNQTTGGRLIAFFSIILWSTIYRTTKNTRNCCYNSKRSAGTICYGGNCHYYGGGIKTSMRRNSAFKSKYAHRTHISR